jgi:hypothetical protein
VHNDDISQILILNKKSIASYESQLFKSELEKFRPHQNRLVQANHKQSALMKELTVTFNNLLTDKRVRAEQSKYDSVQRQRASVVNKYKRAYQEFLDLEAGLQSARRWYKEMRETVDSLEKNVETFVNNRRHEGGQLLEEIEKSKAANKSAQAELERERLQNLMSRMSMNDAAAQQAKVQQASSRPVPSPLFAPGSAPRYPQTNFSGQYQVPATPPANQSGLPSPYLPPGGQHGQAAYNPSAHGRIPGPASPPPNVTSFGASAMRPGPASPPPTVTSFGYNGVRPGPASPPPTQTSFAQQAPYAQSNQYSTYGNQQAQPQMYTAPPGFVPPPPPPGPPPLGPQQTFHVPANDFYAQQRPGSTQPQQQQQGQSQGDPWAGLNSWK